MNVLTKQEIIAGTDRQTDEQTDISYPYLLTRPTTQYDWQAQFLSYKNVDLAGAEIEFNRWKIIYEI